MRPQENNQKNFIVAMLLMLGVLMAWQYFYAKPALDEAQRQAEIQQQQQQGQAPAAQPSQGTTSQLPAPGGTSQVPGAAAVPGASVALPREAALEQSPRVKIDTPTVSGSINLKGARLDDLRLKDYHETVDRTSPTIVLLSPANTENTYFAEQGWLSPAGANYKLPNADTVWSAPGGATLSPGNPVALNWNNGEGLTFTRTFSIDENYMISVQQSVANATGNPVLLFPYARINRQGTPNVAGIYVLFEGLHGVLADSLEEITYADLADNDPGSFTQTSTGGWLGITDKYWGTALIPDQTMEVTGGLKFVGQPNRQAFQADFAATQPVTIAPGASAEVNSKLFAGAKKSILIDEYQDTLGINKFDLMIDWGWFYFITKPMFWLIDFLFKLFGNFGLAILATTVIVKLIFFPLANKSYVSMANMKKVQPKLEELKAKHGDDRMALQQGMMELYKKEKVNPVGAAGRSCCRSRCSSRSTRCSMSPSKCGTRRSSAGSRTCRRLIRPRCSTCSACCPIDVPSFLMIGVWPIIMGITMWLQMRMNPTPPDPTQAMIFTWMPVVFTFMLATFPAGLVIYWAWNNTAFHPAAGLHHETPTRRAAPAS
jgi:YidC/Oxa1 family membrane protein insertase